MAAIETALYEHLAARTGLTALVSTRIYQEFAPTNAELPLITWMLISDVPVGHLSSESGICKKVVQFDMYADTDIECNQVEDALRDSIDGYKHANIGTTSPIWVSSIRKLNSFQRGIPASDGSQNRIYRRIAEYSIWHKEVVPTLT